MHLKKTAFITAEYNPFHNGHLYHIEQTKKAGAENIIVIMSGNYVQRGECALFPKTARATAAVEAGADLVLELPLKYAVGGSSHFCYGAVKTAALTGIDGTLSFGAESDLKKLYDTVRFLNTEGVSEDIKELCRCKGYSFPRARQTIVEAKLGSDFLDTVSKPNNILALQYMTEALRMNASFDFFAVKRIGAAHDKIACSADKDRLLSAMQLRKFLTDSKTSADILQPFVPEYSYERIKFCIANGRYSDSRKFSLSAISRILSMSKSELSDINGIGQGLENVFFEAARHSTDLNELCSFVKSKRYTMSRLRQCCVNAALGIRKSDTDGSIPFVTVLGFNTKGRELLHKIKTASAAPFVGLLSQAKMLDGCSSRDIEIIEQAEYLYNLCLHTPEKDFSPYKVKPYIR